MTDLETTKRLYKDYTKKFLRLILFAVFCSVFVAGSTSAIAYLLDPAIEKIFINKDQNLILIIPVLIVIAFIVKGISLYVAKTTMVRVGEGVKRKIQIDMLHSFIKADTETIENRHTGKYISNLNYDVLQITHMLTNAYLNLFKDSLTLIGLLSVMFMQNWRLSLIAIIMIPIATFFARKLGKRISKVTSEAIEKSGDLNTYLIDLFSNHKIIKIFQREEYEKKRSESFISNLTDKNIKILVVHTRSTPIMEILTGIMIAVLIYYSGKLIFNEQLSINNFFSFLAAMMLAYQPVRSLANINIAFGQGIAAAKRILPVVDIKNQISTNQDSEKLYFDKGNIKFEKINFNYQSNKENKVLKNIDLEIEGGKMTALVGHSGSGKSTLMSLIPRIYIPLSGKITIDKQDISKVNLYSLRSNISIVDQNTTLFDDTVLNNIKYARPEASNEEIYEAADLAMCTDFIENLKEKYKTQIGENGVKLSGGEKQRLSIARAFLKKSKIILLDEATSSLDSETEEKIQIALDKLTSEKTTIVIAHRLSTILNSNKIFVFENGKIVGSGKHTELLENSKTYKNFYERQIKK